MRAYTIVLLTAAVACKGDDAGTDQGNDADTGVVETDTDVDTDADADVDADSDADTDTDTDADTEPAPCVGEVPSGALVLGSGQQSSLDDDASLWACTRATLSVAASNNTIFLENRADLTVTSGSGHVVWAVGSTNVFLTTSGNTLYHNGTARITEGTPGSNTIISCPGGVVLDTSSAPSPGC